MSGSTGWKLVLLMSSALFFLCKRVTLVLGAVYSRGMLWVGEGGTRRDGRWDSERTCVFKKGGAVRGIFGIFQVHSSLVQDAIFFSSFRDLAQQQTER